MARLRYRLAVAAVLALSANLALAADDSPVDKNATEHMVAMRDGIQLATNVFLPDGDGPWPVVITRTPYGKDGRFGAMWKRYTDADYAFVIQDCRGRFRSEGGYEPFVTDRDDGYDTINWVASQDFCDGNVGMSGASAMGITSLLAATTNPESLKAAFVVVAPESFWNEATFIGGVFKEADTGNWMRSQGAGDQVPDRKASIIRTEEELTRDIIHHRDKINIPIYHLGGWYDIFATGTQGNFTALYNDGRPGAAGKQKLLMGPFGHGGLKGELKYPDASGLLAVFAEELRWFDYHLKGEDNGIMDEPAVRYYQMASARKDAASDLNAWQTAENWPPPSDETRLYLMPDRTLSADGPTTGESATKYVFDPGNPVPTIGGANLTLPIGPMDQREIGDRDDYLRFMTPVLEENVSIQGPVRLDLVASTDGPDTDFMVKLVDVYPDGYEALILDAPLRARYRNGRQADEIAMMSPGEPTEMTIQLGSTANTFEAGHRIAVHISSSNSPRFEVNKNNGDPPGKDVKEPRVANNTIHHDAEHPTALVLPVVD